MNWDEQTAQLACWGHADDMVIDPWRPAHQRERQTRQAVAICHTCQLLDRCRQWVLTKPEDPCPVMIVGGLTPAQRREHRYGNQTCGTDAGWQRHRTNGEPACPACATAHNTKTREWAANYRARQKGTAA